MATVLAKAAGVEDPSPHPPDLEAQNNITPSQSHRPSASRASLPLSHRTNSSRGDNNYNNYNNAQANGTPQGLPPGLGDPEDYAWGPSHPCFPHPNPHVPLSSPLATSTKIIRIKRDWMMAGDLAPTFQNLYPEVLEGCMSETQFREVVAHINKELVEAFNPLSVRAVVDALVGLATGWLWEDVGWAGVKGRVERLERWIQRWNEDVGAKEGVRIVELRRTGYMTLDIQIPDPHIGFDTTSRPATGADALGVPTGPQQFGEFGPYPIDHLPQIKQDGQQHLPRGVSVDGR